MIICNLKREYISLIIACTLLVLSLFFLVIEKPQGELVDNEEFYVGVAFCGNTTIEAKKLVDRVKNYTNLFVLQSGPVSWNETLTTEVCDYATNSGLDIIVYFGDLNYRILKEDDLIWRLKWVKNAKDRYDSKFLGIYMYDEPGGIYLDYNWTEADILPRGDTIDDLTYDSITYLYRLGFQVLDKGFRYAKTYSDNVFVSDYGLYWFDYLAGYDVVLVQIGWNHTLEQDIGLARGAANMLDKNWGSMITWKYNRPPYLDSAETIFDQMVISYECGAQYVVIFNYPTFEDKQFGVLTDEHFDVLERFWNDVVHGPEYSWGSINGSAAFVLPKNYGWGMRHPQDRIWGWFGPDEISAQIWNISRSLLSEYGYTLDIIYDENLSLDDTYMKYYFWDGTTFTP
jgi:hypothetical protein